MMTIQSAEIQMTPARAANVYNLRCKLARAKFPQASREYAAAMSAASAEYEASMRKAAAAGDVGAQRAVRITDEGR